MRRKTDYHPFLWSGLIYLLGLGLTLIVSLREQALVESQQIVIPNLSGGLGGISGEGGLENITGAVAPESTVPGIIYFLGVVALLGLVLFFIPVSKLRLVLRVFYGLAFAWGTFVVGAFLVPWYAALVVAVGVSLAWLLTARVWLHNGLLVLTLVGLSSVFGAMVSPWTVIVIMLVIAIYDYLAVRLRFMQWMVKKLSESDTLPAFFIPRHLSGWKGRLNGEDVKQLIEGQGEKRVSILGGGDIFFPLILVASVLFAAGLLNALIVALFTLMGLAAAYAIHLYWLKGKALPALPPIFVFSLLGLVLVRFISG
ncbi:MAG: presenilin family intramembrane aspartyl protease [Chloroflexota bacterium]